MHRTKQLWSDAPKMYRPIYLSAFAARGDIIRLAPACPLGWSPRISLRSERFSSGGFGRCYVCVRQAQMAPRKDDAPLSRCRTTGSCGILSPFPSFRSSCPTFAPSSACSLPVCFSSRTSACVLRPGEGEGYACALYSQCQPLGLLL